MKSYYGPSIPDTFNSLEIIEKGKIDTITTKDNTIQYKQRLLITGFDSGAFTIPPFQFILTPTSNTPRLLLTDSLSLVVQTVAVDTTQPFKDIKTIHTVELTWVDHIEAIWTDHKEFVIAIPLILILIGVIIYILIKRKKTKPTVPDETPYEKAERLLTELDTKQLWQGNKVKLYYIELTDILRTYIEEQFGMAALELTTDELLASMRKSKLLKRNRSLIKQMLRTADMAKFAKAQPLPEEHIDALEKTKAFIVATKPSPEPITNNTKVS